MKFAKTRGNVARMHRYWGAPCPDFDADCIACQAWRVFRMGQGVPQWDTSFPWATAEEYVAGVQA